MFGVGATRTNGEGLFPVSNSPLQENRKGTKTRLSVGEELWARPFHAELFGFLGQRVQVMQIDPVNLAAIIG